MEKGFKLSREEVEGMLRRAFIKAEADVGSTAFFEMVNSLYIELKQ